MLWGEVRPTVEAEIKTETLGAIRRKLVPRLKPKVVITHVAVDIMMADRAAAVEVAGKEAAMATIMAATEIMALVEIKMMAVV